jgi:deoxyadenosine/deoxycytidine kinase
MYISITGNVASGKSCLARVFAEHGYAYIKEPVEENEYLVDCLKDPKRWCAIMEIDLELRFYNDVMSAKNEDELLIITDWGYPRVFAMMGKDSGNISNREYNTFLRLTKCIDNIAPDITFYLDVSPDECYRRCIEERKRKCESGLPLEFFQGLDKAYKRYFKENGVNVSYLRNSSWEDQKDNIRKFILANFLPGAANGP